MKRFTPWLLGFAAAGLLGCSSNSGGPDGGPAGEAFGLPDGFGALWPCESPGAPCEAHNSCVLSAQCGADRLCHPSQLQNCDDALDCTQDICKGNGVCLNVPRAGTCALAVRTGDGTELRCFKDGDRNPADPCKMCVAAGDSGGGTAWGPANGGSCDDGNSCTMNDHCQGGVCKGEDFSQQCADQYSCTDDLCDGNGGCLPEHKLRAGWCMIDDVCYKDQQQDATGCQLCDVKTSQSAWTPLGAKCEIDGKCYKPGQQDAVGCLECDPVKNPTGWTSVSGVCKIDGVCSPAGTMHPQQCATCDPSLDPNGWTVTGDSCLVGGACYASGAKDASGCLVCDPTKTKTDWSPVPDTCKIGPDCKATGDTDATTCGVCDPSSSTTAWTIKGANCLIGTECYPQGQTNAAGCGVCEPAQSKTSWSPPAGQCLIGTACFADQLKDSTGCRVCDASQHPDGWTPAPGVTAVTSTFEDGKTPPAGWTISNNAMTIGWVVTNRRAGQGSYSLYYGDPTTGTFELLGVPNSGSASMATVNLAAGKKAGLAFLIYLDTEAWFPLAPVFAVQVNGTTVWARTATFVMREWQEVVVDLSSYAGKAVDIRFVVDTSLSMLNFGEGVFLDDVMLFQDC